MGFSVPQYFNEFTAIRGYGPVHTSGRWVCSLDGLIFSQTFVSVVPIKICVAFSFASSMI